MIKSTETIYSSRWLLISSFLFIGLVAASLLLNNSKLQMLAAMLAVSLPLIYLLLYKMQAVVFFTIFIIPLSFPVKLPGGTVVSFPAEMLAGILAVFYVLYRLVTSVKLDNKILRHPLTILVMMDFAWLVISTLFSEIPVVSIKRIVVRFSFMTVFFFAFSVLFTKFRNISRVFLLYGLGLLIPVLSTLYNHSQYGFVKAVSFMMTKPFYNDHTQYATCIAYVLPLLGVIIALPEKFGVSRKFRILLIMLSVILIAGEIFSFSRAAWLSIFVAVIVGVLVAFFRFRLIHFMLATVLAGAVIFYYRADIIDYVEKVDAVSRSTDTEDHMKSVMNIETDASNLERINRWQCALRMFEDRPVSGFGPGTYQFIYGKYQVSSERTRISTDSGDRGNAHSEYLTYLSETGIPGFIIFNILLLVSINTAIRIYRKSSRKEVRWLGLAILMGFFTYFFHGLFNSFMDTDKASILVYGTFAALVALDVNFRGSGEEG